MDQFSDEELRVLAPDKRAKWNSIINQHAHAIQQEAIGLGSELNLIFPVVSSDGGGQDIDIQDDAELRRAADRLFQMCTASEQMVSASFAISVDPSNAELIKSTRFWRTLSNIQALAVRVQKAAQN